jgi:hypothetical protein
MGYYTWNYTLQCIQKRGYQWAKGLYLCVRSYENNQYDLSLLHILLVLNIAVSRQEHIEFLLSERQQRSVLDTRPPHLTNSTGVVIR